VVEDVSGISVGIEKDSAGSDLKKLSSFFDSSVSFALIQPMRPLLVLTRCHLTPPVPRLSAIGDKVSSRGTVPASADDSSGAVNNNISAVSRDVRRGSSTWA